MRAWGLTRAWAAGTVQAPMTELGTVLALLHDEPVRVRRLRAEIEQWQDAEVAMRAFEAHAERGGGFVAFGGDEDDDADDIAASSAAGTGQRVRIWVDRDERLEREEGSDGRLVVRRGESWWSHDEYNGAIAETEGTVGTSVADDQRWILGGLAAVAFLRLEVAGAGEVAGRPTHRLIGVASPGQDDGFHRSPLPGLGSDRVELDVDREHGLILRVMMFFDGEPYARHEVVELGVGEAFDDALFTFVSPDGSAPRSHGELHGRMHHAIRPRDLVDLADFKVFVPGRVPRRWTVELAFTEGHDRPPVRPTAFVSLEETDGLQRVRITEIPVDAPGDFDEWDHARPAPWQHETRDGVTMEWRDRTEDWQPSRVRLTRDGTLILIDSTHLDAAALLDVAAALRELRADTPDFGGN